MDYREYRKKYGFSEEAKQEPKKEPDKREPLQKPGEYRQGLGAESATGSVTRNYRSVRKAGKRFSRGKRDSASAKIVLTAIVSLTVFLILMVTLLVFTSDTLFRPDYVASRVNVEAGRTSLKASSFLVDKTHAAEFDSDTRFSLNHVGTYRVGIVVDGKKTYYVKLQVKDTVPPVGYANSVTVRQGTTPDPMLCVAGVSDATTVKASYRGKTDFSEIGTYPVTVILKDEGGNETLVQSVVNVVEDKAVLVYSVTLEAGSAVPDVTAFVGTDGTGEYYSDIRTIDTSVPGIYSPEILVLGKKYPVQIIVTDTVAPTGSVRPLVIYNDNGFPEDPSEFFSSVSDATAVKAAYAETPQMTGNFPITVRLSLTDLGGNVSYYDSYVTHSTDYTPPVLTVLNEDIEYTVGDAAMIYRSNIVASDNSGDVTVSLDLGDVDTSKPGIYEVYYVAKDAAGNETRKPARLTVRSNEVTDEMLYAAIKTVTDEIITANMTTLAKMEAVYSYLTANKTGRMHYYNDSDHDDWRLRAYEALTERKGGDCFAFAAVAQGIFRYLGYETVMVERAKDAAPGHGTHFWIMINVGTAEKPAWYHFDGTPMAGTARDRAYAMTTAQLLGYTQWRNEQYNDPTENYYTFNVEEYPTSAAKVIMKFERVPDSYIR